jgi:predicted deacylase
MSRLSADIDLDAEGKATGFVRVPHSVHRSAYGWIPIPIVRIKNGEGPSVLMQAGNHGDEWEGQIGLGNLIRALEPKDIKGRLVILPSANFPGGHGRPAHLADRRGQPQPLLPRRPEGTSPADRLLDRARLLPGFDYSFDFHSGGSSLTYIPSALAPRHEDPRA